MWELFINLLEVTLLFLLFNRKLDRKPMSHSYLFQIINLFIQAVMLYIMNRLHVSSLYIILLFILIHYLYACIFFASPKIIMLFWSILYAICTIAADALTTIIPTSLFHIDLSQILITGTLRIPFTLIYIAILGLFIIILLCFGRQTFHLNKAEKLTFIFLSFLCITILQAILIKQITEFQNENEINDHFLSVIFFLVIFLFIILSIYVYNLGVQRERNKMLTEQNIISKMENIQYSQIISSVNELRFVKHDLHNHLLTISTLLQNQEYEKACQYIKNYADTLEKSHYIISSGNTAVDSIITNKIQLASANKIKTEYVIHLTKSIPISDIEMCSLIGNLFDNAIEACLHTEDIKKRFIKLHIKPFHNMLSICISNHSSGNYVTNKCGDLLTSKSPRSNNPPYISHGLGLQRIRDIVSHADGFIEITPDKDTFTVSILLPTDSKTGGLNS